MRLGRTSLMLASLLVLGSAHAAAGQERPLPAREQIDRSFSLRPGAAVSVSNIAGPVTIETGGGSRAEVHILREARTAAELACTRTEIENRDGGLSVRQFSGERSGACRSTETRQTVRLLVPRAVRLTVGHIAGRLEIGAVDGAVRLDNIAGRTRVAGAKSADISSIAGRLELGLGPIDRAGVKVSSVAGSIDVSFSPGTGADVRAESIIGRVTSASPAVQIRQDGRIYRARVGAGGPTVSLSSIVGQVRLATR